MDREQQQVLALAAVAQCGFLVHQLAIHGVVSQDKFRTAVHSLFVLNPGSTEAVFGSVRALRLGLETLKDFLGGNDSFLNPSESLRYFLGLLHLESQLSARPRVQQQIRSELECLLQQQDAASFAEEPLRLRELARLYRSTLSLLPFRIHVRGDMNHLKNEHVADKIRILLFAGVRAAFLWEQLGGSRWHLLLRRGQWQRCTRALLAMPDSDGQGPAPGPPAG